MKKLFTSIMLMVLTSASLFSQPPQAFKYQAVVRDAAGTILDNQSVDVRISIHDGTPGGTIVYQETHSETTNQFGLIHLSIGLGTPITGLFVYIDWSVDAKFIEIEVDDGGGYISLGTSELFSVPYALYSKRSSDSYWGLNNSSVCYENGNVGIGTSNPQELLELNGNNGMKGLRAAWGDTYEGLYGDFRHAGSGGLQINAQTGSGAGGWADIHFQTNGTTKMFIESAGNVGIGTTTPDAALHVEDRIRVGEDPSYSTVFGELYHEGGGTGFKINAHAGGGSWADIHFQTNANTRMFIESNGNVGIGTISPTTRLDVQGNVTIRDISTGDIAIQLGKGLDYAEGFDVSDIVKVEPGTILCIDPENPGQLKISEDSYDKTVAGIVAGANGLGSGVRLGTEEFDCDVALAGRVYCNTIATTEDINPGDLLTTSSIPGYAMKVTDFENAQGAILGKAMESMEKGKKGQILVLVTLQ